jgi:hypothetical protein
MIDMKIFSKGMSNSWMNGPKKKEQFNIQASPKEDEVIYALRENFCVQW